LSFKKIRNGRLDGDHWRSVDLVLKLIGI